MHDDARAQTNQADHADQADVGAGGIGGIGSTGSTALEPGVGGGTERDTHLPGGLWEISEGEGSTDEGSTLGRAGGQADGWADERADGVPPGTPGTPGAADRAGPLLGNILDDSFASGVLGDVEDGDAEDDGALDGSLRSLGGEIDADEGGLGLGLGLGAGLDESMRSMRSYHSFSEPHGTPQQHHHVLSPHQQQRQHPDHPDHQHRRQNQHQHQHQHHEMSFAELSESRLFALAAAGAHASRDASATSTPVRPAFPCFGTPIRPAFSPFDHHAESPASPPRAFGHHRAPWLARAEAAEAPTSGAANAAAAGTTATATVSHNATMRRSVSARSVGMGVGEYEAGAHDDEVSGGAPNEEMYSVLTTGQPSTPSPHRSTVYESPASITGPGTGAGTGGGESVGWRAKPPTISVGSAEGDDTDDTDDSDGGEGYIDVLPAMPSMPSTPRATMMRRSVSSQSGVLLLPDGLGVQPLGTSPSGNATRQLRRHTSTVSNV